MKIFLILLSVYLTTVQTNKKSQCHACFEGICYSRSRINNTRAISGQLAVDRTGNIIHFHYEVDSTDRTAAYDLKDIKFLDIPNVGFSFARAVDQSKREIYIGGAQGMFKYNPITNQINRYGLFDKTIWQMQFKKKIYYTELMTKGLFSYDGKRIKSVEPLSSFNIEDFVIDKKNDVYFTSNSTVFRLKNGDTKPKVFTNITYNLVTDIYDNVYFIYTANRGLYRLKYGTGDISLVGAFASGAPFKTVFDNFNNLIYYDPEQDTLFYLTPNYGRCRINLDFTKKKNNIRTKFLGGKVSAQMFSTMKALYQKNIEETAGDSTSNFQKLVVVPSSSNEINIIDSIEMDE